ncbi:MAG TPA: sulfatase-like hydrolase/transferase [Kofleriaceae bacterium]|nr:sulfatase-like hydrolase/transferase [Kofleriaceae bacterium]
MTHRHAWLAALLALAACGKDKDTSSAEAAPAPGGATAAKQPAKAPVKAAARGPEHAVYSLVDSRLSGHLLRNGGLVVPGGSAGFAKYVRFGNLMKGGKRTWELRQQEGDIKVARITGKSGTVFVPLTAAQAGRNTLRFRLFAQDAGAVSVRVNENKDLNGQLTKGWSTVELTVPAGQLKEGENSIAIFTKSSGSELAWLQVGATAAVGEDGAVKFYEPGSKSLTLPKDGGMSWFVAIPEKAKLTGDLSDGACTINVLATAEDGATLEGKLTGIGSAIDLGAMAGKAARLDLEPTGCAEAQLASAAIVVPGAAPTVKRADPPKYVVFVIMDSLRADRIRVWNPKARPEVPNWEKLAETSSVFLTHYVQGNESQVSHASMWSSEYLAKHKASEMKDKLDAKLMTIEKVAKKANKYAAGASANGYIRPERGFGNAWDQFVNHITKSLGLKGADVVDKGISFITPKKDQPWFLYLGLIDTHVTWRAKSPWMEKYDGGYKGKFETSYGDDGPGGSNGKGLSEKEQNHVRALYDSNVSYQDDLLGKLVEQLQTWGIYDKTMIIITADHGDEQWEENDRVGHGGSQRETLVHVPMLIHYPPLFPATKVHGGTEGIDIVPTLADALGVAFDPEWQGTSLLPLAQGNDAYPLLAMSSAYENMHAGRIGHWKLQLKGGGAPRLWNLAKDPDERNDLWGKSHIGARLLLDPMWILRGWNVEWKKSQWGNAASVSSRFASDLGE